MRIHEGIVKVVFPHDVSPEHEDRFWAWVDYWLGAGLAVEIRNGHVSTRV